MKVLFLNRVYPPADGATGHLLKELAERLVERGLEVTVVTSGAISELKSQISDSKRGLGVPNPELEAQSSKSANGVRVERVGCLPFSRSSLVQRALSYLSLYPRLLWRALRLPKQDVVVTMTDPPMLLVLGVLYKWLRGGRLVHWAQDLYPELAIELGVLSGRSPIAKMCRAISSFALRRHERVVALGRCMQERILQRGVDPERVRVIPNWAQGSKAGGDTEEERAVGTLTPDPSPSLGRARGGSDSGAIDFRRRHGYEGKFVVMYSGNLGLAHCFESILAAAEQLQTVHPETVFLFVGSGPRLPWVQEEAKRLGLANVHFLPSQPLAELSASLKAADVHLVSMRENLSGLVVPSKAYGIFAAGRPCFFIGPKSSEVARLIVEHGCGEVFASYDTLGLVQCLVEWSADRARRVEAGQQAEGIARRFHFDAAAEAFQKVLEEGEKGATEVFVSAGGAGGMEANAIR